MTMEDKTNDKAAQGKRDAQDQKEHDDGEDTDSVKTSKAQCASMMMKEISMHLPEPKVTLLYICVECNIMSC